MGPIAALCGFSTGGPGRAFAPPTSADILIFAQSGAVTITGMTTQGGQFQPIKYVGQRDGASHVFGTLALFAPFPLSLDCCLMTTAVGMPLLPTLTIYFCRSQCRRPAGDG